MKFTPSMDGVERTNIRITVRFSAEELAEFTKVAREDEEVDLRTWLERRAYDGIYRVLLNRDDQKGDRE